MKKLREKLQSQNGASILLALLFLLVCTMVAGSVLTAAASNAGKIRSNYQEQQRYLALSSALRLVVGELKAQQTEYRGRYTVNEWTEILTVEEKDAEGKVIATTVTEYPYYNVRQETGLFTCGQLAALNADGTPNDDAVLTFRKELDGVFAGEFTGVGYHALAGGAGIASLPTNPPGCSPDPGDPSRTTRVLTVTVGGSEKIQEQFRPVTVAIDMSQSRRIHLKATLPAKVNADGSPDMTGSLYIMEAELTPRLTTPGPGGALHTTNGGVPVIDYTPEAGTPDRLPKDEKLQETTQTESGTLSILADSEHSETKTTSSFMTWKLDWITREIKEEASG